MRSALGGIEKKTEDFGGEFLVLEVVEDLIHHIGDQVTFPIADVIFHGSKKGALNVIRKRCPQGQPMIHDARSEKSDTDIHSGYKSAQIAENRVKMNAGESSCQYGESECVQVSGKKSSQFGGAYCEQRVGEKSIQSAGYNSYQESGNHSVQSGGSQCDQITGSFSVQICKNDCQQIGGYGCTHVVGNRVWIKTAENSIVVHSWKEAGKWNKKVFEIGMDESRQWYFYENGKQLNYGDTLKKEDL